MSNSENPQTPAENGAEMSAQGKLNAACVLLNITEGQFEKVLRENAELAAAARELGEKKLAAQTAKATRKETKENQKNAKAAEKYRRWKRNKPFRMVAGGVRMVISNILVAFSPILALAMGTLIVVFLLPSLTKLAMQEEQIKQLQKDVETKTAEIFGVHEEAEEGESAWEGIETNLRDELADVRSELSGERVNVRSLREEMTAARERVRHHGGILGEDGTLAEGIDSAAEKLNQELENWHALSDTSRDGMHDAQQREIRTRTQGLKAAADAWKLYMGLAHYNTSEFRSQNPATRRDAYATAINSMLGVIKDQAVADLALQNASERFWASTTEEGAERLCIDAILETLRGMRQDRFSFTNGIDREVEGLINRLKR